MVLENRGINYMRFVLRQKVVRLILSPLFPKTGKDGFQSDIGLARILAQRRQIDPRLQLITPLYNAQLHVVPY